jgi:hypothetical protein
MARPNQTPGRTSAAQSKSRMYAGPWLAIVGGIMAVMYVINAIQASSIGYFVAACGWALVGATQWWGWRSSVGAADAPEAFLRRKKIALYVTLFAFLIILGGLAARWWA